ncbi:hypothetical protein [Clostridium celatum]|uniref:hypothetical protein n=1 Tax=Clostridium celatum TaxID=36834 RepID=UPI00291486C5|nr:hypothetical protein [Clostridium celatum]MDU6294692.1 hypothetical protein [Clostridium celatum]
MNKSSLKRKIILQKITLNLLLKFLSPKNSIVISLSQILDKHISNYQKLIYKRYKKRHKKKVHLSKSKAA